MAEHIICFTANGGIPLFSRTQNDKEAHSFPVMGSLNGVHLFGKNKDVSLISSLTTDHRVVWKTFQESIVLIAVFGRNKDSSTQGRIRDNAYNKGSTVSDAHFIRLLDNVFHSLVLIIGLDELCSNSNLERLKRDLRSTFTIIDSFLNNEDISSDSQLLGDLTQCVDMVICKEANTLQEYLNSFVTSADSTYGCLVAGGRVVCATEKWWMLTGTELALLGRIISIMSPNATSSDIPVYLPHSSPNIPHRLLMFTLISSGALPGLGVGGVRVCVLCGPKPTLAEVQNKLIESVWNPALDTLQKSIPSCIIGFPFEITHIMPDGLLAFLLINRDSSHCVSSTNPHNKSDLTLTAQFELRKLLREFYMDVVGTSFPLPDTIETEQPSAELLEHTISGFECYALMHYRCLNSHKCFANRNGSYQIFALFNNDTPTFALQSLTEKLMHILVPEK